MQVGPGGYVIPPGYQLPPYVQQLQSCNSNRTANELLAAARGLPQTLQNLNTYTVNSISTTSSTGNQNEITKEMVRRFIQNELSNQCSTNVAPSSSGVSDVQHFSVMSSSVSQTITTTSVTSSTSQPIDTQSIEVIPSEDPIVIENSCLSFIRSQMFRISKEEVTSSTAVNFGLQEIKEARETLFRKTGTLNYRYQGPKDPSTQNAKSKFCVLSIIQKIEELGNRGVIVNFCNSSEDLYRLSKMIANQSGDSTPDCFKRENLEEMSRKITLLTNDVNHLKSLPHNKNSAAIPAPRFLNNNSGSSSRGIPAPDFNVPNRLSLLNSIEFPGLCSPARARAQSNGASNSIKRRRTALTDNNSPSTTTGSPAWKTVQKKRSRPELDIHIPKGRPPKPTTPSYELFLFRYSEDETPGSILKYFKEIGASSVHHVRYCGSRHNGSKSFVLKFKEMNDFKVIIRNLPEYTGARPYTSEPPNLNEDRPPAYFNAGGIIRGPEIEKIFEDDESSPMDSSETPVSSPSETAPPSSIVNASSSSVVENTTSSPASSPPSQVVNTTSSSVASSSSDSAVDLPSTTPSVSSSVVQHTNPSISPVIAEDLSVTLHSASATSHPVISTVTSDLSCALISAIRPLDSPHMRTNNVSYESVVSNE